AWQALGRLFAEPLLSISDEPAVRRRREIRRLETTPLAPLSLAESRPLAELAQAAFAPAVEPSPEPSATADVTALAEQLLAEVASSLRGRTLSELAGLAPEPVVAQAAAALMGEGRLVRR